MKKSIFLFFAAILCAIGMQAADTYYFRGGHNSWGGSNKMTTSTDGHYVYYHINDISMGQGKEFKINKNNADDWNQNHYEIVNNYNGTDLKITASDNRSISAAGYVILYLPNTLVNPSNKAILCASTKLTDGIEQVFLKHPWNGGSWEYCNALTKNSSGKLVITKKYGNAGCNWSMKKEAWHEKWVATPTLVNEPQTGDECEFAFNPADQTITITKQLTKNLGSVTVTMTCNQQPNIYYFGGVDGSVTYPEWPGVNMTDNGDGTYSYKVDNVNLDLGLDYVITLKEVNENEWKSEDLNAKADVSHDVSIFNFPKIVVLGINEKWDETNALTEVSNDYLTVSKTISFAEAGSHNLKCHVGSAQYQGGNVVDITRANPSSNKFDKDYGGDGKFTADINGDYVFTWTYKTGTLSVTYPELPTPEYKDITIQVYAKQVPNIWWWNGGDQCPSTEEITNPSTGNKYKWEEAPAMEAVVVDGNTWYQKKFENVDVTKGGIKFKLQSADHSVATTNEVTTTEDKCYDARVIATVTETTCGQLPTGETPKVTYNVEVPAGTNTCYIAGEMNSWTLTQMTKVDDTHYTITIEGATTAHKYKYASGPDSDWKYVEVKADGSEVSNRTYNANDVVEKWKSVYDPSAPTYDYYIAGTLAGGWSATQQGMTKEGDVYKHTFPELNSGTYEFKITDGQFNSEGDNTHEHTTLGAAYEEVSYSDDGNVKIITEEAINLTVIFDATADKITFEGLTVSTAPTKYYVKGTHNEWTADATSEMTLDGDVYKKEVTLAKDVEFKINDGATGWWGANNLGGKAYKELEATDNLKMKEAKTFTIIFNPSENLITFDGLTEETPVVEDLSKQPSVLYIKCDDWKVDNARFAAYFYGTEETWVNMTDADNDGVYEVVNNKKNKHVIFCRMNPASNENKWDNCWNQSDDLEIPTTTYLNYWTVKSTDDVWNKPTGKWMMLIGSGDNSEALAAAAEQTVAEVYVNRSFDAGQLYTIALPFDLSDALTKTHFGNTVSVIKFVQLDKDENDDLILWFDAVLGMGAGVPYVITPSASVDGFVVNNVAIKNTLNNITYSTTGASVTMEAVLSVSKNATTNGKYWLASDTYLYNASAALKSLRAVFNITTKSNMPPRVRIAQSENVETGVEDIIATDTPVKAIVNGQLIIIRDGIKYNVQGQKL